MLFADAAYAMGAGQGAEGGNPIAALMPLILMFVIFYFLLIRPQQKKAKQHKEVLANLKKGDKILTGGGMYGRITEVDGDVLVVDLGNNQTVEINRNFVSGLAERAPKGGGSNKNKS
jgi:preprotein translocase subunit YajC